MLRSPLHLLISLRRLLQWNKIRYKPTFVLFRPIAKTTSSRSATFISRISTTPATTKCFSIIGQQRITTRRLFMNRRYQGIQYRTMISPGNSTGTSYQITHLLNGNHFFTPRPSIIGFHGGTLPPASLRSYVNNKPPWSIQQSPIGSSSTADTNDIDDVDDTYSKSDLQYHRISHQRTSTRNGESYARQQVYRPPDIRGMVDLMTDNDGKSNQINSLGNGSDRPTPGLVHRNQSPKRQSPPPVEQMRLHSVEERRHDDVSPLITEKRQLSNPITATTASSQNNNTVLDHTQQIYLSIPMDLSFLLLDSDTSFMMDNAVSILDPLWKRSFDQWGNRIRYHLTKVMILIQLIGSEARHYYTTNDPLTSMEFKMKMNRSELRIYLPPYLCSPLPTTIPNVRQWVDGIMNEPPSFDIKWAVQDETNNDDDDGDDGSMMMIPIEEEVDGGDGDGGIIGSQYFQDIHAFLNNVDSMIDTSPAFATGSQRRFSL